MPHARHLSCLSYKYIFFVILSLNYIEYGRGHMFGIASILSFCKGTAGKILLLVALSGVVIFYINNHNKTVKLLNEAKQQVLAKETEVNYNKMIHKEELDMWKSRYDRVVSTLARREQATKELEKQIDELEKYSKDLPNTSSEVIRYTMDTIRNMEGQNATSD